MKLLGKTAVVAGLAGAMALSSMSPSEARWRGWPAVAGFVAGATIGAAAANASAGYYGYGYNNYAYAPAYGYGYTPAYSYGYGSGYDSYGYAPAYDSYAYEPAYESYAYAPAPRPAYRASVSYTAPGYSAYAAAPAYTPSSYYGPVATNYDYGSTYSYNTNNNGPLREFQLQGGGW